MIFLQDPAADNAESPLRALRVQMKKGSGKTLCEAQNTLEITTLFVVSFPVHLPFA